MNRSMSSSAGTVCSPRSLQDLEQSPGRRLHRERREAVEPELGASLALFDAGAAALKAAADPKDKTAVAAAIGKLSVDTPIGC